MLKVLIFGRRDLSDKAYGKTSNLIFAHDFTLKFNSFLITFCC